MVISKEAEHLSVDPSTEEEGSDTADVPDFFTAKDPRNLETFLKYLSKEELDTHPNLLIQIWADEIIKLLANDYSDIDLTTFEPVLKETFLDYYYEDRQVPSISEKPLMEFFDELQQRFLAANNIEAFILSFKFSAIYMALSSTIKHHLSNVKGSAFAKNLRLGSTINHAQIEKLFTEVGFLRLVKRPKKKKVVSPPEPITEEMDAEESIEIVEDPAPTEVITVGELTILSDKKITFGKKSITVGNNSAQLLEILMRTPNKFINRNTIVLEMNNKSTTKKMKYRGFHVSAWLKQLVYKLEILGVAPEVIQKKHGKGIALLAKYVDSTATATFEETGQKQEARSKEIEIVSLGDLHLHLPDTLIFHKRKVRLGTISANFLQLLMKNPDRLLSRQEIIKEITGRDAAQMKAAEFAIIITRCNQIRVKLKELGIDYAAVEVVRGKGLHFHSSFVSNPNKDDIISFEEQIG